MNSRSIIVLAALYTHEVCSSIIYHGPTARPVVLHNSYLAATHEVAAAKNTHLTTASDRYPDYENGQEGSYGHGGFHGNNKYNRYYSPTDFPYDLHDGNILDTSEVIAFKDDHLAVVPQAQENHDGVFASVDGKSHTLYHGPIFKVVHKSGNPTNTGKVDAANILHSTAIATNNYEGYRGHNNGAYASRYEYSQNKPYHGPIFRPVVLKSGYLADTPEVAAARANHLTAVAKASVQGSSPSSHNGEYASGHGYSQIALNYETISKPVALKSKYQADIHNVAMAKPGQPSALVKTNAHGSYSSNYNGEYASGHGYSQNGPYYGPSFSPVVLNSGYLPGTHDVARAKEDHLNAVAKANAHGSYISEYNGEDASSHGLIQNIPYQVPLFIPIVLSNGYLDDIHEINTAQQKHPQLLQNNNHHSYHSHH